MSTVRTGRPTRAAGGGGPLALAAAALAASVAAVPAARADEPLWELGIGASALRLPHYRGSDESQAWVLPLPWAVYRGPILRANRDGARAVLLEERRVAVEVSVAATAPVRSSDSRARAGMADLPATLEIGPTVNLTLAETPGWKLDLRLPLHAVATLERHPRGAGWTAAPVLNLDHRRGAWNFGAQAGVLWGSRRYHDLYYGVAEADAAAGRPAYAAPAGYGGTRLTLSTSRRFGDAWFGAFVRHDSVAGARFRPSPLVRQTGTWSAGVALSWIFARSEQRVAVDD